MNYRHLYSTLPNIRRDSAEMIAECILRQKKCTRRDIAKYANISDMSATKAVSSLFDSGIISEKELKSKETGRQCGFISVSHDNPYIVIDISIRNYKMYCLNSAFKVISQYNYRYEDRFSLPDNLSIFMERGHKVMSEALSHFCGICLLTKHKFEDIEIAKSTVSRVFSHEPDATIDVGVAVSHLMHSNVDSHLPVNSLFYVNIGSGCESYFVLGENIIKCNPHKLVGKNNVPIGDMIDSCVSSLELYEIIFDIFNCASSMLCPEVLILESDRFILGSQMTFNLSKKLKINFADSRRLLISDKLPHLYIKGALLCLIHTLMVRVLANGK